MEKALAYRKDVDQRDANRRSEAQRAFSAAVTTWCEEATIRSAMAAIDRIRPASHRTHATAQLRDRPSSVLAAASGVG
jgi:hypothetical protein